MDRPRQSAVVGIGLDQVMLKLNDPCFMQPPTIDPSELDAALKRVQVTAETRPEKLDLALLRKR